MPRVTISRNQLIRQTMPRLLEKIQRAANDADARKPGLCCRNFGIWAGYCECRPRTGKTLRCIHKGRPHIRGHWRGVSNGEHGRRNTRSAISTRTLRADARLIAATNRDLEGKRAEVRLGSLLSSECLSRPCSGPARANRRHPSAGPTLCRTIQPSHEQERRHDPFRYHDHPGAISLAGKYS